jgi:hypothetical protein
MKLSRFGQMTVTLAFTLFVAYATGQGSGLVFDGFGRAIAFLVLVGLLLFVVRYSHTFYKAVAACLFRLSAGLFAVASDLLLFSGGGYEACEVFLVPDLPSRFQRPPPIFLL